MKAHRSRLLLPGLLLAASTGGCASTEASVPRAEASTLVVERGGVVWSDEASRETVQRRVLELLGHPLTRERALQIAVLNNRELQATLEELGVAQADLVAAGLLENPSIGGDLVVSTRGNGLGGGLSLSQSLLGAFLIPAKRRLAKADLRVAVLHVADATLSLLRDVEVAHADLRAAVELLELRRTLVQAAEVADELAQRQLEAGNLPDLDRELLASALDEARLELAEQQVEVTMAREALNRLLGLWGPMLGWTLAEDLPVLPEPAPRLQNLEALAVDQRLDVASARAQVEALQYALALRRRGIVPRVEAGAVARNEVGDDLGHEWVIGPSLSIEIPIFDPGHADLARLRAQLRQAQYDLEHQAIVARSEIRAHRDRLVSAARRVRYLRDEVLPRRTRIVERALEQYNAMVLGAYDLLEIRAEEVRARMQYIEALRGYWIARADLERAAGGRLR